MSEHFVKLIPCLPTYRTNVKAAEQAVEALGRLVRAEGVAFRQSERPELVDCGAPPEEIRCPRCGAPVDRAWWGKAMERMYQESHFFILEETMPCCGRTVNFNDLRYVPACGFSCLEFILRGPEGDAGREAADLLSERFGVLFRQVEARV